MSNKKKFIKDVIQQFTVKINQDEANDQLIHSLIFLGEHESYCRSYPEISDIIYHLEKDKFHILKENFALLDEITENKFAALLSNEKIAPENGKGEKIDNLLRFERHIKLSCYQRDYILRAKGKVGHIYSEFVGILAIFTAMSFAMMGSVQVLGNLFHDVKLWGKSSIGYALVIGGIYILIMYLIIMILLVGMKKLYGDDDNDYKFTPKIVRAVIEISIFMIVTGILSIWMLK